jgi:hypothetical protein
MKPKIILAFILLLSAFSCKKEASSDALTGKWRTTEILFTTNMSEPLYIQFIFPGKVQSTFFSKCTGYNINGGDLTLKYTGASISQAAYTYSIKQDTLTLNQNNCTSGCTLTFVKE